MSSVTQHVLAGRGKPTWTPAAAGTHYCDKDTQQMYISVGTDSPLDWVNVSSGLPDGAQNGQIIQRVDGGYAWITPQGHVTVEYVDLQDQATLDAAKAYIDAQLNAGFATISYVEAGDAAVIAAAKAYIDAGIIALGSGVPVGGLTGEIMTKVSDADGDATWQSPPPPGASRAFLDAAVQVEKDYIATRASQVKELPPGGDGNSYLAKVGDGDWEVAWVPFLPEVRKVTIKFPEDGAETPDLVDIEVSPYAVLRNNKPRLHREFQIDELTGDYSTPVYSHTADVDNIQTTRLPVDTDLKMRVRDVATTGEIGEWTEVQFRTKNIYNTLALNTGAVDGKVSDPITLSVVFSTVNGVDEHVGTDWVVKKNGTIVWSSLNDAVNLTSVAVPEGILTGDVHTVEARVKGAVYGWSAAATETVLALVPFNGLVIPHNASPFFTVYQQQLSSFSKVNVGNLPPNECQFSAFSPDGKYLAVAHVSSPYVTIYSRNGVTFTKMSNPVALPTGHGYGCCFSSSGEYLVVTQYTSPYLNIYKHSNGVFTKQPSPNTSPTGVSVGCAFSSNDVYLAVAHTNSPYITVYKNENGVFTKIPNPTSVPTGEGRGCAFSPDNAYLAVSHYTSPYITLYNLVDDVLTKLNPPAQLPTGTGFSCAFSPDGNYLSVSHDTSPFITIYSHSSGVLTKLANPNVLPTGTGYGCAFSPDSAYLAVSHGTSPFVTIYGRTGDVFTKVSNPDTLPSGVGWYKPAWYYESLPVINSRAS